MAVKIEKLGSTRLSREAKATLPPTSGRRGGSLSLFLVIYIILFAVFIVFMFISPFVFPNVASVPEGTNNTTVEDITIPTVTLSVSDWIMGLLPIIGMGTIVIIIWMAIR